MLSPTFGDCSSGTVVLLRHQVFVLLQNPLRAVIRFRLLCGFLTAETNGFVSPFSEDSRVGSHKADRPLRLFEELDDGVASCGLRAKLGFFVEAFDGVSIGRYFGLR